MFNNRFKVGDNVVIVSTNEFLDENKVARKIIAHGKAIKVTDDEIVVEDHYGTIKVTKYTVLYEAVSVKRYLQELECLMNDMYISYIDIKTLHAILKLDEWKRAAIKCGLFHWL